MLPTGTVFVGGFHDTAAGSVVFFDLGVVPETHRQEFEAARDAIASTCLRSVQGTSVGAKHGDSRNAITIVGRRELTRGLSFDGGVALASYDPSGDDVRATILTRSFADCLPGPRRHRPRFRLLESDGIAHPIRYLAAIRLRDSYPAESRRGDRLKY